MYFTERKHDLIRPCGPRREKTCLRGFAYNTGADQPAHSRSLISAFVIRFLESTVCKLTTGKISFFYLVSVAENTGLNLTFSELPKTGFLATRPMSSNINQSGFNIGHVSIFKAINWVSVMILILHNRYR